MGQLAKPVAGLPAHLQNNAAVKEALDELAGGVTSSFPIISYRGRTWRVRKGGEEQVYLNDQDEAVQSIEVALVRSNHLPSKLYYDKKYEEGDSTPPRCWSANGVKPDNNVVEPISPTCAACPMNIWGSKISENGNKTRACADSRRMTVAFGHEVAAVAAGEMAKEDLSVLLLRVPPASLNPLKDFAEKVLKPKGIPPFAVLVRIGFDTQVAYPKLTFKATRFFSEDEYNTVVALRDSDIVKRILQESFENESGESTESTEATAGTGPSSPEGAKASPASDKKAGKLKPVEEEERNFSEEVVEEEEELDIAPAPAPTRPAAVESLAIGDEEEEQEEEIAPAVAAPPTKKRVTKKAPTKRKAPEVKEDDFENMLNSILG